jgi:16S rRNA (cytosine1402-N4)-methyltransferase
MSSYHIPVLLKESVSALFEGGDENGLYIDATFGGGGHSREILSRLGSKGKLLVFDRDADAEANLPGDPRVIFVNNNYRFISNFVRYHKLGKADGILADLGVSSHQFDTSERGFSFRFDADLDMRMNRSGGKSASDIVNSYPADELARILKEWGEVDNAGKVASLICEYRQTKQIRTTGDLNRAIERVTPLNFEHKYLAKIYQALRIEVNGEMDSLGSFLEGTLKVLKSGGRLVVITYHSLEDRMVKNFIKSGNLRGEISRDLKGNRREIFESVTKKPLLPCEDEISINTRARSAKLRVARMI